MLAPDPLTFAGPFAAGAEWYTKGGLWQLRLLLERCGSRLHRETTTRISTSDGIPQFAINRRALVWLAPQSGPIHGLFLPSLQKFTIASLRAAPGDLVLLTSRTLYIDDGLGSVIAAPSPRPPRHHRRHAR